MAKVQKIPVDEQVDRFVEHINQSPRVPRSADELPVWLRVGLPDNESVADEHAYYDWQIRKAERTGWIDALEARLPFPFPPSFRSLVRRYVYPGFDIGSLGFYANTGEPLFYEMSDAILRDAHLQKILVKHGYLHFARPDTGDYDPVCFDTRRRTKDGEYPIVRVEHESILCYDRIGAVWEIAPSFASFIVEIVDKAQTW